MGFSHRARLSSERLVRRSIRIVRSSAPLAFSASGLITGSTDTNSLPVLRFLAVRVRAPSQWGQMRPSFLPCPEGEPEEGKRRVLVLAPTLAVFAVDDPRLVGMQAQATSLIRERESAQRGRAVKIGPAGPSVSEPRRASWRSGAPSAPTGRRPGKSCSTAAQFGTHPVPICPIRLGTPNRNMPITREKTMPEEGLEPPTRGL